MDKQKQQESLQTKENEMDKEELKDPTPTIILGMCVLGQMAYAAELVREGNPNSLWIPVLYVGHYTIGAVMRGMIWAACKLYTLKQNEGKDESK